MSNKLEELQKDYNKNEEEFKEAGEKHSNNKQNILDSVIQLAKYSVGDRVNTKHGKGIIRCVYGKDRWKDKLRPYYSVGKIIKSGRMHATQDIHYWKINEADIISITKETK